MITKHEPTEEYGEVDEPGVGRTQAVDIVTGAFRITSTQAMKQGERYYEAQDVNPGNQNDNLKQFNWSKLKDNN